jgi:hypothetical protein
LSAGVVGQAYDGTWVCAVGVGNLDRSPCAPLPMVDADKRQLLPIARPGREGQLVLVLARAWPDQDSVSAAVRPNRRNTTPGMRAPTRPPEHDRAPVGRPGWMHPLSWPSPCPNASQAGSICVDGPQPRAGAPRNSSPEDDPAVARAPADAGTVGLDLTDPVRVAAVAVHHEQRADIWALREVVEDEGDPPAVARPGRDVFAASR